MSNENVTKEDSLFLSYVCYVIGCVCSFGIAADCAIAAIFYCSAVYGSPILLGIIAASSFVLNFSLYQVDSYQQIYKIMEDVNPMENPSEFILTMVSICSGFAMGLFSYAIYMSFPVQFPFFIVVLFCAAYVGGTAVLMRNSLNKDKLTEIEKRVHHLLPNYQEPADDSEYGSGFQFSFFVVTLLVFVVATMCLTVTWWSKVIAALMLLGLSSQVAFVVGLVLVGCLAIAEVCFCVDKASQFTVFMWRSKANESGFWWRALLLGLGFVAIGLNGLANGIMGANEFANKIVNSVSMYCNIALSSATMATCVNNDLVKARIEVFEKKADDENQVAKPKPNHKHHALAFVACSLVLFIGVFDMQLMAATWPLVIFVASLDLFCAVAYCKIASGEDEIMHKLLIVMLAAAMIFSGGVAFTVADISLVIGWAAIFAVVSCIYLFDDLSSKSLGFGNVADSKGMEAGSLAVLDEGSTKHEKVDGSTYSFCTIL